MITADISVIIPSYNGQEFIAEAIQSINKQTYPVKEIIIVDDESTDATEKIVLKQAGNIRFIKQKHTGMPAYGRNRGVIAALGEYIAFLDQDDWWPKNKLAIQINNFMNMPGLHIDVGFTKTVNSPEMKMNDSYLLSENDRHFLLSSMLIRKTVFDQVGLFDETMQYYGSDLDWVFRAKENKLFFNIHKEVTLYYRWHDNNHSKNIEMSKKARIEVMKKSLLRRKVANSNVFKATSEFKTSSNKNP